MIKLIVFDFLLAVSVPVVANAPLFLLDHSNHGILANTDFCENGQNLYIFKARLFL